MRIRSSIYKFDKSQPQGTFFNYYFIAFYRSSLISATAFDYIEDSLSWRLGFGLCVAIFLFGQNLYWCDKLAAWEPLFGLSLCHCFFCTPDNINCGRLGIVCWTLVLLAMLNFGYRIMCCVLYKCRNVKNGEEGSSHAVDIETKQEA